MQQSRAEKSAKITNPHTHTCGIQLLLRHIYHDLHQKSTMKTTALLSILLILTVYVTGQVSQNEKNIEKALKKSYAIRLNTNNKLYYLQNARYNPYSQTFTASIGKVDSSELAFKYYPVGQECLITTENLEIVSVFVTFHLKQVKTVIMGN